MRAHEAAGGYVAHSRLAPVPRAREMDRSIHPRAPPLRAKGRSLRAPAFGARARRGKSSRVATPNAKTATNEALRPLAVPIGPRLERIVEVAYRARRPVLISGPTGVGKSEIVRRVADTLKIQIAVLDLSLLEPPDLVGLPVVVDGRTQYALPSILPREGAGILLLEELNRAERYIQQPALQLLSARRLHEYVLPNDWVCIATVNPQTADYHVTALDKALRARFLEVNVRADRASWLAWAEVANLHPGVLALAHSHERMLEDVPPRTWTYASQLLQAFTKDELTDGTLLRDALGGYLPAAWVETLLASQSSWAGKIGLDVRALLSSYTSTSELAKEIRSYREQGQTDRIDEIVTRLRPLLSGPEAGVLAAQKNLTLASFESFISDLPGDQREKLQDALGENPTLATLADVDPTELLAGYNGSAAQKRVASLRQDPVRRHRIALVVTALCAFIESPSRLAELKRSNVARMCLGQVLLDLPEKEAVVLATTLRRVGVTPVRPGA